MGEWTRFNGDIILKDKNDMDEYSLSKVLSLSKGWSKLTKNGYLGGEDTLKITLLKGEKYTKQELEKEAEHNKIMSCITESVNLEEVKTIRIQAVYSGGHSIHTQEGFEDSLENVITTLNDRFNNKIDKAIFRGSDNYNSFIYTYFSESMWDR